MNTGFYVSAIDTPDRKYLMLGPFAGRQPTDAEAVAEVKRILAEAK